MQQASNEPLYWAKDRVPFNLTLVLALGIAGWGAGATFGLWDMGGNSQVIFLLGIGVAIYTWLFTPRAYLVYQDSLCVAYGKPRIKVMHFSNISVVEMGSMAALDQLRVRPVKGRRQSIRVREPEVFFDALEAALNAYRAAHPEEAADTQFTGRRPPDVIEGEGAAFAEEEPAALADEAAAEPAELEEAGQQAVEAVEEDQPSAEAQPNEAETSPEATSEEAPQGEQPAEGDDSQGTANRPFY